jgi:hypothetical protein
MSSNRQRHRQQVGTTLTNEPQNSPGVAQFSVSEVAQFSMSLDTLRSSFSSWLLRRRSARRGSALLEAAAGGSLLSPLPLLESWGRLGS